MKPMLAWCHYCDRRLIWGRRDGKWRLASPGKWKPRVCYFSPNARHEPVMSEDDTMRAEVRRETARRNSAATASFTPVSYTWLTP